MDELKKEILKIPNLIINDRVNGNVFRGDKNNKIKEDILTFYSKYDNIKMNECIYLIMNGMSERPKCECERKGDKTFISYKDGYYNYCGKPNVCSLRKQEATKNITKEITKEERELRIKKYNKTCLEKYGVDNFFKSKDFISNNFSQELIDKRNVNRQKALQEKYGVNSVFQLEEIKTKIRERNIEKYNKKQFIQIPNKHQYIISMLEKNDIRYSIIDKNYFSIPKFNLAIKINEVNKLHSDKNYHQNKYDICKSQGIELVQFWDIEINNKIEVIESFILNKCMMTKNKEYARQAEIKIITNREAALFINENHLQDIKDTQLSISLGAFINGNLLSVIAFRKDSDKYILSRFCSKIHYNIVGIFSKMMKFFNRFINVDNLDIITYSDNRYSSGELYSKNNFSLHRVNSVSYYYTKNFSSLIHRSNFMKSKMKDINDFEYDDKLTEHQNMINNGYCRVYGCKIDTWLYNK